MNTQVQALAGIDVPKLEQWLDERNVGAGAVTELSLITGGTQNILARFRRGDRSMVLRRPPLRPRPKSNATILREASVLSALDATDVPHPAVLAINEQDDVLTGGADQVSFFVMDDVRGFNPLTSLPAELDNDRARADLVAHATRTLADIGEIDYAAAGLESFGRPENFLRRQVSRWVSERDSYASLAGYPAEPLPHFDRVAAFLDAQIPTGYRPGLIHGDYHLGNVLVDATSGEVAAVVDWEMWTVGDPLADFGRLLAAWPDEHEDVDPFGGVIWSSGAMPGTEFLVDRYRERTSRSLDELPWYVVLGCFKLGIILEGTYARACADLADRGLGDLMHTAALQLFRRAGRLTAVEAL